uniref:DUF4476 domain-containing protein n=1 Tax=Strongyloides venezuelensis TaxID=75913 RepID=A0A0K0FBW9_STRVS
MTMDISSLSESFSKACNASQYLEAVNVAARNLDIFAEYKLKEIDPDVVRNGLINSMKSRTLSEKIQFLFTFKCHSSFRKYFDQLIIICQSLQLDTNLGITAFILSLLDLLKKNSTSAPKNFDVEEWKKFVNTLDESMINEQNISTINFTPISTASLPDKKNCFTNSIPIYTASLPNNEKITKIENISEHFTPADTSTPIQSANTSFASSKGSTLQPNLKMCNIDSDSEELNKLISTENFDVQISLECLCIAGKKGYMYITQGTIGKQLVKRFSKSSDELAVSFQGVASATNLMNQHQVKKYLLMTSDKELYEFIASSHKSKNTSLNKALKLIKSNTESKDVTIAYVSTKIKYLLKEKSIELMNLCNIKNTSNAEETSYY